MVISVSADLFLLKGKKILVHTLWNPDKKTQKKSTKT